MLVVEKRQRFNPCCFLPCLATSIRRWSSIDFVGSLSQGWQLRQPWQLQLRKPLVSSTWHCVRIECAHCLRWYFPESNLVVERSCTADTKLCTPWARTGNPEPPSNWCLCTYIAMQFVSAEETRTYHQFNEEVFKSKLRGWSVNVNWILSCKVAVLWSYVSACYSSPCSKSLSC